MADLSERESGSRAARASARAGEGSGDEALVGPARRVLGFLVLSLIVASPLLIGTVHVATRTPVFVACALALAFALADRRARERHFGLPLPLLALAVAFAATALQLVPIPAGVLATIAPATHATLETTLGAYGAHPLSLDPPATVAELAKIGAYAAFYAAATVYSSRPHRRRRMLIFVAGVATVATLVGFAQAALHARRILFVYTPEAQILNEILVRGPFVNPNHFGALLCLGAPAALALGLREPKLRAFAFPAAIIINVGVVLSLSRSAMIAAPVAQLVTFAVDRWKLQRGSSAGNGARVAVALLLLSGLAIALSLAAGRILPSLDHTLRVEATSPLADPSSKFHVWTEAGRVVRSHPVFGAGRGAFEQAHTQVADRGAALRVRWVENGYLQAAADWGIPVALTLLLLAGASLFVAVRRLAPDPVSAGALGGVVGLAIHDFADFASELPGVALPALALLACLYSRQKSGVEAGLVRARVSRAAYLVPAALLLPILATIFLPLAEADARRLTRLVRDPTVPVAQVLEAGRAAQRRHPADYFVHLVVSERLVRERHPESLRWLNDAMALNPTHPAPHLMAAELLAATGRMDQALLEYRAALALSPTPQVVWERLGARTGRLEDLLAAAPPDVAALSELGSYLLGQGRAADAEVAYLRAHTLAPEASRPLRQLTHIAAIRGDRPSARARAEMLLKVARDTDARYVAARAYVAAGALAEAGTTVDLVDEHSPAAFAIGLELAHALVGAGEYEPARARLDRLSGYGEKAQRIALHEARAEVEEKAGNAHQAEWERQQAEELKGGK